MNSNVVQDHLIKRTNRIQYGRELHRLSDAVIEKYGKEACRSEVEDLNFWYQKFHNIKMSGLIC